VRFTQNTPAIKIHQPLTKMPTYTELTGMFLVPQNLTSKSTETPWIGTNDFITYHLFQDEETICVLTLSNEINSLTFFDVSDEFNKCSENSEKPAWFNTNVEPMQFYLKSELYQIYSQETFEFLSSVEK
jgi:hypothetical protein